MDRYNQILKYAKENNEVVLSSDLKKNGISTAFLTDLVRLGRLHRVDRGIYVTSDGYVDDFFITQYKYKKGVFSHETALFLHGFSDRPPNKFVMTFPQGYSTSAINRELLHPVTVSKGCEIGITKIERNGMELVVYDIERTIVDLLKPRYKTDIQQLIPALRKYAEYDQRDLNKLYKYAKEFKVLDKIQQYMEVLL